MIKKFRAWDGLNKKMSFWTMNDLCNHTNESEEKPSALEEWMQYTGLKDKNGKEIYEGDIIEWCGFRRKIYKRKVEYDFIRGILLPKQVTFTEKIKIIGNIYENPKLTYDIA